MKPSVQDILAAAQKSLKELVAPKVDDEWAASALRSVDVILSHLQARVPVEGPMLYEDIGDLAAVFGEVGRVWSVAEPLAGKLTAWLEAAAALRASGYPSVDALTDCDIAGRALVNDLLLACHAAGDQGGAGVAHAALRGYLERHLEREQSFYFPTFVGRPV